MAITHNITSVRAIVRTGPIPNGSTHNIKSVRRSFVQGAILRPGRHTALQAVICNGSTHNIKSVRPYCVQGTILRPGRHTALQAGTALTHGVDDATKINERAKLGKGFVPQSAAPIAQKCLQTFDQSMLAAIPPVDLSGMAQLLVLTDIGGM